MRTLSTLYKIAYGRIKDAKDDDFRGICHLFDSLERDGLITYREEKRMLKHLYNNKPEEWNHPEFAILEDFDDDNDYWFPRGQMVHRKAFIKKMINYSKPWYVKLYLLWKDQL